jgi:polar amino acid transport system permease protein
MSIGDVIKLLLVWTPFLAGGFAWNIVIALTAMTAGTAVGGWLAVMRASSHRKLARLCEMVTEIMRDTPTIVCQFYLVFMLPVEVVLPMSDIVVPFPSWLKAALALAFAVGGFVSDNLGSALKELARGNRAGLLLLLPNWTSYFVVIVIASSGASVIGVDELVSRCNSVVNAVGKTQMMLWVYLYAMFWFFLFCFTLSQLVKRFGARIERRAENLGIVSTSDNFEVQ